MLRKVRKLKCTYVTSYRILLMQLSFIQCRIELEKTRLLVLEAADQLDRLGNKKARGIIAMAKVVFCLYYEKASGSNFYFTRNRKC